MLLRSAERGRTERGRTERGRRALPSLSGSCCSVQGARNFATVLNRPPNVMSSPSALTRCILHRQITQSWRAEVHCLKRQASGALWAVEMAYLPSTKKNYFQLKAEHGCAAMACQLRPAQHTTTLQVSRPKHYQYYAGLGAACAPPVPSIPPSTHPSTRPFASPAPAPLFLAALVAAVCTSSTRFRHSSSTYPHRMSMSLVRTQVVNTRATLPAMLRMQVVSDSRPGRVWERE